MYLDMKRKVRMVESADGLSRSSRSFSGDLHHAQSGTTSRMAALHSAMHMFLGPFAGRDGFCSSLLF